MIKAGNIALEEKKKKKDCKLMVVMQLSNQPNFIKSI